MTPPTPATKSQRLWRAAQWDAEREKLVSALWLQLFAVELSHLFVREYRFHPERKWRLDLYCDSCPGGPLAVECHGGIWTGGRHTRGGGFLKDREKVCAAIEAGIRVLEYGPDRIKDGSALAQIERVMTAKSLNTP